MGGLASSSSRTRAADLFRSFPQTHRLADEATEHRRRRTGSRESPGGARPAASSASNAPLLVPDRVHLRRLGSPLLGLPHRTARRAPSASQSQGVRDFATHLAVHRRVSASTAESGTQRGAVPLPGGPRSRGRQPGTRREGQTGIHLPVVLSMPETAALLGAMSGTTWLMAALIYGGGLRVSECCALRIKDLDFDQGLVFVRDGKGGKDRSTLLAELARDELRRHLHRAEAQYRADRAARLAGVWMPDSLDRKYPERGPRARLVLGVSQSHVVDGSAGGPRAPASHQRLCDPEGGKDRRRPGRRSTSPCRSTRCATASRRTFS